MIDWYNENTKFYGLSISVKNNIIETTFESGKTRTFLKNSTPTKTFSIKFKIWDRDDELSFWDWYINDLQSRAETFVYKDLIEMSDKITEYRLTNEPKLDGSQYPKEMTINLEEA